VLLLVFSLAACGGSGSGSASSSTATSVESVPQGPGEGARGDGEKRPAEPAGQGGGKGEPQASGSAPVAPLHVSGGGSGQFRVKGGDNSIEEFGEESGAGELEEAAAALHDFFVARAEEDWRGACSQLSKNVAAELEQLASRSKSGKKGCPATLAGLTPPLPPAVQRESTVVDAGSLRLEGERAFLIYRGAEKAAYAINMAHEDGKWKVGSLAPVPLQ
jgi:hypothetical protein